MPKPLSMIWLTATLLIVLAGCQGPPPQRLVCPAPTYDPPKFPLPPSQVVTMPDNAAIEAYRKRIDELLLRDEQCSSKRPPSEPR